MTNQLSVRPEELVVRARELAGTFAERAAKDPMARRIPEDSIADLRDAGLFRVLQAGRNGGFETDLVTHLDVVGAVAEGCPSTGWVVGVAHAHSWLVSHFGAEAQDDVYGADPDTLVAGVLGPRGEARPTERGWGLSGLWPFGSGVERADWALLGAKAFDQRGDSVDGLFLVPTSDVDVADDWDVSGLKATGSCTMATDDVFVPAHRFLPMADIASGQSPGYSLHDGSVHRSAMAPVLTIALTGAAVGAGRAVIASFAEQIDGRLAANSTVRLTDRPTTQRQLAEATMLVHQGDLLLRSAAVAIDEQASNDETMVVEDRARIRMECAQAVRSCLRAAEMLYVATGGRGLRSSNRMAGLLGDLQAMNMHALLNFESAQELYGQVLLGLEPSGRI